MVYTLGTKCAKNCKRTILVQLIAEDVVTFFETQCRSIMSHLAQHRTTVTGSWPA